MPRSYRIANYRVSLVREGTSTIRNKMVDTPRKAAAAARAICPPDLDREHIYVMLVNVRKQLIATQLVSIGHVSGAVVHPREVFKPAILAGAAAVILVHNHPSGDAEPSAEDETLTRRLYSAGVLLGIELLDHIVLASGSDRIANKRWVSLKELGRVF